MFVFKHIIPAKLTLNLQLYLHVKEGPAQILMSITLCFSDWFIDTKI